MRIFAVSVVLLALLWKLMPVMCPSLQVELLCFKGEVLTEDGGVMRRIKVKGEGFNNPNEGSTVDGVCSVLTVLSVVLSNLYCRIFLECFLMGIVSLAVCPYFD